MFDVLNQLHSFTTCSNFYGKLDSENLKEFTLYFKYDTNYDIDTFINQIVDIYALSPIAIKLISSNTLPPLKNSTSIEDLRNNITTHLNKHLTFKSNDISYKLIISKISLINSASINRNINYFYEINTFSNILINPIYNIEIMSSIFCPTNLNIVLFINTTNIYIENSSCIFISLDQLNQLNNSSSINSLKNKIDLRKICCNIEFNIHDIVPDFFIIDFENSLFKYPEFIKILFKNLFLMFFLLYIANYSSYNQNSIKTKISSNKSIDLDYSLNCINEDFDNYIYLIHLYNLAYNSNSIENLYLVRNMICLHLSDDDNFSVLLDKSKLIFESSKENLSILSIQNVEKYFSIRYELYDFLDKSTSFIENKISDLIDKINKTFISTIATLIGVSLVYLKDRNFSILRFSLLIYTIYLVLDSIFYFTSTIKFYNTNNKKYNNKLLYFKPIIGTEHYDKIVANDDIKCIKSRFYWYYSIILLLYILMISAGLYCFFYTDFIISIIKTYILK